jgi:integrase
VAHLEAEHRKTRKTVIKVATLRRALASLVTVANLAKVTPNPFHKVLPKVTSENDSDDIDEYSDSDIKVIRKNLHKLCEEDRLLVRLLACTGMNRDEAFQIKKEYVLDGIRYCEIGTKSGARKRRVPFPADLLPHLPAKIDRPLFKGRQDSLTKRIGAFMSDIGVINDSDGRKISPLHSFRHRAATRIRLAYPASDELLYAIGGWARGKKNSSRTYGTFPISVLKEAIDKIGFEGQRRASRS